MNESLDQRVLADAATVSQVFSILYKNETVTEQSLLDARLMPSARPFIGGFIERVNDTEGNSYRLTLEARKMYEDNCLAPLARAFNLKSPTNGQTQ